MLSKKRRVTFRFNRSIFLLFLFIACSVVGILGYQDSFITSLSHIEELPKTQKNIPILPSIPYKGRFTASYNRLGIVKVRMSTNGRINTNTLIFRLKEQGSDTWFVENTYVTDRFIDGGKYPFGFPVIPDSKGKIYEYELTTPDGMERNTISVIPGKYASQTDYIYSKAFITSDSSIFFWFLNEKVREMFGSFHHILYWIMCFLPLLCLTNAYFVSCIFIIILFGFLPMQIHSNIVLWIGAVILGVSIFRKRFILPFELVLFCLAICVITYYFQLFSVASKLATIVPILLTVGAITTFITRERKPRSLGRG